MERVGAVRASTAYCGIGRRYHVVVCTTERRRQNVSAAVCGAAGRPKADASNTQVVRPIRLLGSGAMDAILIRRRTISTFFMEIIV